MKHFLRIAVAGFGVAVIVIWVFGFVKETMVKGGNDTVVLVSITRSGT